MKAYRYFPSMLCLIGVCLSVNRVYGAVQINPNPEKQPTVVMIQYHKDWTYSSVELDEVPISDDETENIKWDEGKPGSWAYDACWGSVMGDDYYYGWNRAEWGADGVGTIAGDIHRGHKGDVCGVRNGTPSSYTAPTSWPGEFCTGKDSRIFMANTFQLYKETVMRNVHTRYELRTGGKARSRLKNLFRLTGSASGRRNLFYDEIDDETDTYAIAPTSIRLGSFGKLDSEGKVYKVLPNNRAYDITPFVSYARYYTRDVGAPQKYTALMKVSVTMPYPTGPKGPWLGGDSAFGHCWWSFISDAPIQGLLSIGVPMERAVFLNKENGYTATSSLMALIGVTPGELIENNGDPNVERFFKIGFDKLVDGLGFTFELWDDPGNYAIGPPVTLSIHNCVSATREAADKAGVRLPLESTPQNMGVELKKLPDISEP